MQNQQGPSQQFLNFTSAQRLQRVLALPITDQSLNLKLQDFRYPEQNFIDFDSTFKQGRIKLMTYRADSQLKRKKGVVIFIHSIHSHASLLAPFAKRVAKEGFVGVSFDFRGHGKSGGERGQWTDFKGNIEDLCQFIRIVSKMYPNLAIFLNGQGLGATTALYVCLYHFQELKIAGLIIASGVYKITLQNRLFKHLYLICMRIVRFLPGKMDVYKLDYSQTATSKQAIEFLLNDPLNFKGSLNAQSLAEMTDLLQALPTELWNKMEPPPIVIIHGEANKLVSSFDAYTFFSEIRTKDKQLWYYKEMGQKLTVHKECGEISERLAQWLNRHVQTESRSE